eukprot:COSAG01_NODE_27849_length_675_cov_1.234375_1_plen_133_part_10
MIAQARKKLGRALLVARALFESATGAAPGHAGLPMSSRAPPQHDVEFDEGMEQQYLADRQLAIDERNRRAGVATAAEARSAYGRAAYAADFSDDTPSERDEDDDYDIAIDNAFHIMGGDGTFRRLKQHIDNHS